MSPRRMFRSKARWTSAAAVLVVLGVLAGTMLASAAGPPLPKRSPAQLLVAMRDASPPTAMTAVITQSANLGFPSLPNIPGVQSSVLSGASFLTGTHTIDVWYDGPRHVRIALPVSFGETDLRVNGNQAWLWNSHGQTATHYILPARSAFSARAARPILPPAQIKRLRLARPLPVLPRCLVAVRLHLRSRATKPAMARAAIVKCLHGLKIGRQVPVAFRPLTPQQAVSKFLAAVGPTTKVTVAGSTTVAGRPAYQLTIAPRTSQSLISQIVIAVDSKTYLPLRLQVFARGMSSPAFQIGFTALTFGKPAASNFTFTPPAGAHVKTEKLSAALPGFMGPLSMGGLPAPLPGPFTSQRFLPKSAVPVRLPLSPAERKAMARWVAIKPPKPARAVLRFAGKAGPPKREIAIKVAPDSNAAFAPVLGQITMPPSPFGIGPAATPSGVKVLGSGWLSVAVIPVGDASPALWPSVAKPPIPGSAQVSGPPAQIFSLLRILMNSAAVVHGDWGWGRLLRTSLFSVLFTNHGKVLIGAVTPDVLYADAAKVK